MASVPNLEPSFGTGEPQEQEGAKKEDDIWQEMIEVEEAPA